MEHTIEHWWFGGYPHLWNPPIYRFMVKRKQPTVLPWDCHEILTEQQCSFKVWTAKNRHLTSPNNGHYRRVYWVYTVYTCSVQYIEPGFRIDGWRTCFQLARSTRGFCMISGDVCIFGVLSFHSSLVTLQKTLAWVGAWLDDYLEVMWKSSGSQRSDFFHSTCIENWGTKAPPQFHQGFRHDITDGGRWFSRLSPCFFSHESRRHNLGPDVPFSYPHSNSHIGIELVFIPTTMISLSQKIPMPITLWQSNVTTKTFLALHGGF